MQRGYNQSSPTKSRLTHIDGLLANLALGPSGFERVCSVRLSGNGGDAHRQLSPDPAAEFGAHRITVNAYCPGNIDTPMSS